ncbi:hypothetical protein [Nostoc sp. CALU 1950]|uniref:hypothetical protein n=1 Tax=Nostoc sp. CALU 1950 TaxID=3104321 RepID=UPI003EBF3297
MSLKQEQPQEQLQEHITFTYTNLRIGIAGLAIVLPFLLWIVGYLRSNLPLQESMSAYYHSGGGTTRDVFVGILCAVGVFLYLYKGYTNYENYALNLAGVSVVGVALFPMEWGCGNSCSKFSLHGTFAILFFLSIAYVCIFRASDTLKLIKNDNIRSFYSRIYPLMGIGMIVFPIITVLLTLVLQPTSEARSTVFFVEAVAIFIFASYWIFKSREIDLTHSEELASEGKLKITSPRLFRKASVQTTID